MIHEINQQDEVDTGSKNRHPNYDEVDVEEFDIDAVEELADRIVGLMSSFIDFLRSEFIATTNSTKKSGKDSRVQSVGMRQQTDRSSSSTTAPDGSTPAPLHLWSRMVETGLWNQVQSLLNREREIFQEGGEESSRSMSPPAEKFTTSQHQPQHKQQQVLEERSMIVEQFALPLIRAFTLCYQVLDRLPNSESTPSAQPKSLSTADLVSRKLSEASKKNQQRKKSRPPPPRGMLSLQNYTDVACFLEFVVCTGIMPHLETGILWEVKDRVRYQLPKSLAGRIPTMSLYWGTDVISFGKTNDQIATTPAMSRSDDELINVVTTMANILQLDRFRPMMLPRHLSDMHAALFQAEQIKILNSSTTFQGNDENDDEQRSVSSTAIVSIYNSFGLTVPTILAPSAGFLPDPHSTTKTVLDPALQARTYQTLLLNGKKSPLWLRKRVSPLLTDLACRNLAVIIAVFVPQQGNQPSSLQDDMSSSACQRLGQTLATSAAGSKIEDNNNRDPLQDRLCVQILHLLNWVYPQTTNDTLSSHALAIIQTAWSILDHLPDEVVDKIILVPWRETLTRPQEGNRIDNMAIHRAIRQIGTLFSFVPPPQNGQRKTILVFLLRSESDLGGTIFNQLVRLTSASKIEVVNSLAREDVRRLLRMLTEAINVMDDTKQNGGVDDDLVVTWVDALAPSLWDLSGYSFVWNDCTTQTQQATALESIAIVKRVGTASRNLGVVDSNIYNVLDETTARTTGFLENVLKVACVDSFVEAPDGTKKKPTTSSKIQDCTIANLPSRLFRWLLQNYLPGDTTIRSNQARVVDEKFRILRRLVSMILLPTLCEEFSQEQLLFGNGDDGLGLLALIKNTISQLASLRKKKSPDVKCFNSPDAGNDTIHDGLVFGSSELKLLVESQQEDETLPAIASIVMSMLIAILELGSEKRLDEEESLLQSLLPVLQELSQFKDQVGVETQEDTAIADMASYAMPLIAARINVSEEGRARATISDFSAGPSAEATREKIRQLMDQSALDLKSSQPPIRAKGIVTLGRIARGFAGMLHPQQDPIIVEEWGQSGETIDSEDMSFLIDEILQLSMTALADEESYVYLAAVQTIVALGDLHAKYVLPAVAACVATGQLTLRSSSLALEKTQICDEQRIKLAEALMFTIRRRAVMDEFVPTMVNLMLYGTGGISSNGDLVEKEDQIKVLVATRNYFIGETDEDPPSDDIDERREYLSERDLRLKTGGPIFDVEEADVVRSVRVSVLAELVSHSSTFSVAPHTHDLVRLVIDALRLDHSRSVGRAAALLAVAIYSAVLKESDAIADVVDRSELGSVDAIKIPFTLALIKADEAMLLTCLQQYQSTEIRLIDEGITARCREALKLRLDADEGGILLAAQLMATEEEKSGPIPVFLTSMLDTSKTAVSRPRIVDLDPLQTLGKG
jgi:Required for nuclear transport of RNA pol II C-terminus 1